MTKKLTKAEKQELLQLEQELDEKFPDVNTVTVCMGKTKVTMPKPKDWDTWIPSITEKMNQYPIKTCNSSVVERTDYWKEQLKGDDNE